MRHALLLLFLAASSCSGGGSHPNGNSDADIPQPDARELSGFLGPCQNDLDCISRQCLDIPHVCTKTCSSGAECPFSSSWRCGDVPADGNKQCLCTGQSLAGGCDTNCDGVDEEDPAGSWVHSVQSTIFVPYTQAQTSQYGFDLDFNGNPDNQFRFIVTFFATIITGTTGSESLLTTVNQDAVNAGAILFLHSFHGESTTADTCTSWKTYLAQPSSPPDFSGSGAFTVDPTVPASKPLYGSVVGGTFTGSYGEMPIRLKMGPSPTSTVTFSLRQAHLEASLGPSGCLTSRLGGGIPIEEAKNQLVPALASEINRVISLDPQSAHAQQLKTLFDTNHDGVVLVGELQANSLVQSTIVPDVDLVHADGSPGPDGVIDSMSIALGFGCAGAVYAAPGE